MNREELDAFIGRPDGEDQITAQPLRALSAVLDHETRDWRAGDPVPPAWHWLYFLPLTRQSHLGADGRAARGTSLPGVDAAKRMFAGARMKFHRPLRVGDTVVRESSLVDRSEKQGRRGTLVFVTTRFVYRDALGIAIEEEQDIVFRPAGPLPAQEYRTVPAAAWQRDLAIDPVLLFRFSALTFNGHRIHYDLPYAQREGYPGLVVHGPLLAILLLDLAARNARGRHAAGFSFRAHAPAFADAPLALRGDPRADGAGALLRAYRPDGVLALSAELSFAAETGGIPLYRD